MARERCADLLSCFGIPKARRLVLGRGDDAIAIYSAGLDFAA
jgi:hypothetical protein